MHFQQIYGQNICGRIHTHGFKGMSMREDGFMRFKLIARVVLRMIEEFNLISETTAWLMISSGQLERWNLGWKHS